MKQISGDLRKIDSHKEVLRKQRRRALVKKEE